MKTNPKSSIASRASVRSLIVACLPAAALAMAANSPVLGAVFSPPGDQGLAAEDNSGASTNVPTPRPPSTNSGGASTNRDVPEIVDGMRG